MSRKLIIVGMLAISFIATAQYSNKSNMNFKDTLIGAVYNDNYIDSLNVEVAVEEDAPFDFNTKDYLPLGFNPYAKTDQVIMYETLNEEADAPFDFDTKKYLPKGFDAYKGMITEKKSAVSSSI